MSEERTEYERGYTYALDEARLSESIWNACGENREPGSHRGCVEMSDIALPLLDFGDLSAHTLWLLCLAFAVLRFARWVECAYHREQFTLRLDEICQENIVSFTASAPRHHRRIVEIVRVLADYPNGLSGKALAAEAKLEGPHVDSTLVAAMQQGKILCIDKRRVLRHSRFVLP
jgi:hypothetical protein